MSILYISLTRFDISNQLLTQANIGMNSSDFLIVDNQVDQQTLFSSHHPSTDNDLDYHQLKQLTLQLWRDKQQLLGNLLPSNADLYQIIHADHPLGIDAFFQVCLLSPLFF